MNFEFEAAFDSFVAEQISSAKRRRMEMLQRDISGTRKMFKEVLWPVFGTFDGFILEYEMESATGIAMFIDAFYEPLQLAFECEGFAVHAETITRDRFSFEKSRVRTMVKYDYTYIPFSWDELDKRAESCRSFIYELLGRYRGRVEYELTIYEQEVLRRAALLGRPFRIQDVSHWLQKQKDFSLAVIRQLTSKKLIRPYRNTTQHHHEYIVEKAALQYIG